jgi:hypothetical protein
MEIRRKGEMTAGMDHAMSATRGWHFVLRLTLVIGALDLVAACATGQSRDPTGQEISTAVGRADSGITAGPTGGAPYGSDAHRGLDYQERRRLVEAARATHAGEDQRRQSKEAADRVMSALAGNEPGYEEAARALYAGDRAGLETAMATWPADVRAYSLQLAAPAFARTS